MAFCLMKSRNKFASHRLDTVPRVTLGTTHAGNPTLPPACLECVLAHTPQLTDEFMQKAIPACSSVADAREKLFEAQQLKTAEATQRRIVNALSEAVADIVEADVPQSLLNSMGENECAALQCCSASIPVPLPKHVHGS